MLVSAVSLLILKRVCGGWVGSGASRGPERLMLPVLFMSSSGSSLISVLQQTTPEKMSLLFLVIRLNPCYSNNLDPLCGEPWSLWMMMCRAVIGWHAVSKGSVPNWLHSLGCSPREENRLCHFDLLMVKRPSHFGPDYPSFGLPL